MNRTQIESHPIGKELSKMSNQARHATVASYKSQLEKEFDVTIEDYPFTAMNELDSSWFYISAIDSWKNQAYIIVFKPKQP